MSSPGARARELDRHLRSCAECRTYERRFEAARDVLSRASARARDHRPDPTFAARVAANLDERPSPIFWASMRLLPVTGALALALLGWCWLATPPPEEVWSRAAESDVLTWVSVGEEADGT